MAFPLTNNRITAPNRRRVFLCEQDNSQFVDSFDEVFWDFWTRKTPSTFGSILDPEHGPINVVELWATFPLTKLCG